MHQPQRLRDEDLRGHASGVGTAHHRDAYLLALEECALEVSQLSRELAPYMAFLVCQAPSNVESGETRPPTVADLLTPLLSKVGRLHALVDNHVHLHQPAGRSVDGHNVFCAHAIKIISEQTGKF